MDEIKNGGPAFPINGQYNEIVSLRGMSLRDYFAAAALQGLLASSHTLMDAPDRAYEIADAMLAVRPT